MPAKAVQPTKSQVHNDPHSVLPSTVVADCLILAVLPYFPYSRQSKKKSHRGAITARMLANLLNVAGVKHVITVDLHASQMQGFFRCPVDNLHAEPIIARWIRRNVPHWKEAVVVSKNAGGTKRVTSLADALKLNFGMVTTDRKRTTNMSSSMIMNHFDTEDRRPALETSTSASIRPSRDAEEVLASQEALLAKKTVISADSQGSPKRSHAANARLASGNVTPTRTGSATPSSSTGVDAPDEDGYDDHRPQEVTHGRLVHGHVVEDDFPSPQSPEDKSDAEEDPMAASHASSFFVPEKQALGGSSDPTASSDEEDNVYQDTKTEHMITLVGDVKNKTVFIVDDMIDKPGSWIAAAETVVKRGRAKKVYCIATHGVFGADCLDRLQACECIDSIVVTNSFPISHDRVKGITKLVVLDLSILLSEAIRRNHYGESISPLYQHTD